MEGTSLIKFTSCLRVHGGHTLAKLAGRVRPVWLNKRAKEFVKAQAQRYVRLETTSANQVRRQAGLKVSCPPELEMEPEPRPKRVSVWTPSPWCHLWLPEPFEPGS